MSGLSGALNIGRLALAAQQYGMQVTGNNVANVNTKGYTRQRAVLTPGVSIDVGNRILLGSGVDVKTVQRVRDTLLDIHMRSENGAYGRWTTMADALSQLETIFSETSTGNLGDAMNQFWNAWSDLSNDPENPASKSAVKEAGVILASRFNNMSNSMNTVRQDIDSGLSTMVDRINSITNSIFDLNRRIMAYEGGGTQKANDDRDQRDLLLDELSNLVDITYSEMPDGTLSVFISGSLLVSGGSFRTINAAPNAEGYRDLLWADNGASVNLNGGEAKGLLDSRDVIIPAYIDRINGMARAVIESVNRIHSRGANTQLNSSVTSANAVTDPASALNAAGLAYTPVNGSFTIAVYDADGNFVEEQTIIVDPASDSLNDIRDAINAAFVGSGNITASISSDNRLTISSSGSNRFSFVGSSEEGDSSDLLMALGMNTFFSGSDAQSMKVDSIISEDYTRINTGFSLSPGDNRIALEIASIRDWRLMSNGTQSISNYYESTIGMLGTQSLEAGQMRKNSELLVQSYENQREIYSGVSLDEEMTEMLKYQHAYNAAARFISTISELMQVLFNSI